MTKFKLNLHHLDKEMVEMTRDTPLGIQVLAVVHCDAFSGDVINALMNEKVVTVNMELAQ